jgi:hypothetical protein
MAMVGDNDVMFHRVEAVGAEQDGSIVPIDSFRRYDALPPTLVTWTNSVRLLFSMEVCQRGCSFGPRAGAG